ncbi:hypothetical protein O181_071588 [Austropuccinia psidii MF-1]|uniref:Uncharacterized protein n=1 Tax=Austropuccinia psidii MF-1 TaxID=1389203 RepID=A0A9Q3F1B3_9BASI|nr:hypothetical protein [Austropuccinia psidii MF-1]
MALGRCSTSMYEDAATIPVKLPKISEITKSKLAEKHQKNLGTQTCSNEILPASPSATNFHLLLEMPSELGPVAKLQIRLEPLGQN